MSTTSDKLVNWSGSYRYRAGTLLRPESLDELRSLLAAGSGTVQVLATRHTFNAIGDADALIGLGRLPEAQAIEIDAAAMRVRVGPAVTYAELAEALQRRGLALPNLASLPHISVAGAVATATHGSGVGLGNLATAVRGLELITSEGDALVLEPGDARVAGASVHLGALGVLTALTLEVVPSYELRQDVYLGLEWDALAEHYDAVMSAGRSVSVFHDFGARAREVWVKGDPDREVAPELFGARPAQEPHNPVPEGLPENCTAQLGSAGPWSERLPHFRSGFTPSSGQEIQSEWFVARSDGVAAIQALRPLAERMAPVLQIAELRVIDGDELWMSPHSGRESAGLHFTWRLEPEAVAAVCAEIQDALAPFAPRPHWGKVFAGRAGDLWTPERLPEFLALRSQLDPRDRFVNRWLREHVIDPAA